MNLNSISHYRNLKHLSQQEWQQLDIHLFIAANFNRYCSLLIKKIGYQHLPSDAMDSLLSLYCMVAFKPLVSVHLRHLDAEGEKRNQVMLGTLKMISMTRMIDAVIQEYPSHLSLDQITTLAIPPGVEQECATYDTTPFEGGFDSHNDAANDAYNDSRVDKGITPVGAVGALSREMETPEDRERFLAEDEQRKSAMIELARHCLTVNQYQTLRHLLCDDMDTQQIAALTGTSLTNIRIMLLNIRKRLHQLLPADVATELESCLFRK